MSRFKIEEKSLGKYSTIKLSDDYYGSSIEIAQVGATLLSFIVRTNRGLFNLIDGYTTDEELDSGAGCRSWIMAPFTNRLSGNSYKFQGKSYKLGEVDSPIINGLIAKELFVVENVANLETSMEVTFSCNALSAKKHDGYPFPVDVFVKYIFEGNALTVNISGKNTGKKDAPFCAGWHPYFRVHEKTIDSTTLTIPAERLVLTDFNFIPFRGPMTYTPISNLPGSDFRSCVFQRKRVLGRRQLNVGFSHLTPGVDGMIVTKMENQETGSSISIKQKEGVLYAYSGDDLTDRPRTSISFQPMESITDAFNREEEMEMLVLRPGEEREFSIQLEFFQQ